MKDMILLGPQTQKMTSLEIAELVESRHDKVKQSIERLAKRGTIELPPLGEISTATKPTAVYLLDKRSSLIVVAQLSPEFTARVVDRWQELENNAANQPQQTIHQVLSDPAAMRGLLLTYSEKVLALEATVTEQAPKCAAHDLIALADGLLNITNAAKTLQINPNAKLFRYMQENSWIYRRAGGKNYVAYQQRIQQGLLTHKVTTVKTNEGMDKIMEQVLVTPKGLAKLAGVFSRESRA
jgi:phage antirepressor YoqD-like protein